MKYLTNEGLLSLSPADGGTAERLIDGVLSSGEKLLSQLAPPMNQLTDEIKC